VKRILIIEDNAEIMNNLSEILQLAGYSTLTAENGKTGIETAIAEQPDLIICDITMPVLDGYGVLHLLHKNMALRNTPFIFVSSKCEKDEIRKGMEMGSDDYITKPFNVTELLNSVAIRLKKADQIKQDLSPNFKGVQSLLNAATNKDVQESIKESGSIQRYQKAQEIYMAGQTPGYLYFIVKGKVRTYKRNDDGKELIVGLYNEGDFFGYTALLEQRTYSENAEALEYAELVTIPREDFETLLFNNYSILHKFMQLLSKNVTEKEEQLLGIAYNSLRKKVSTALLFLYKKYNPSGTEKYSIDMSRDSLAALTGVAKESLIRTLGDFRDEKMIEIKEGAIFVIDKKKLERILN
jgi:CRP-like cAMP-binding protein/AmiR/NasT family two-component response regulator